jgi:sodium/potassium-transporting ATPase subunit beta
MIWAECKGVNPYDNNLLGGIDYYPWRGYPAFFFPYKNETRYMEPLMAIHLKNARGEIDVM